MPVRVAINGFGRIGRNIVRAIYESGRKDIDVVAVNDLGPVETNAHLLRYDSVHGKFPHEVKVEGDSINIGTDKFKVTAIKDPSQLPWKELGIDIALECTGIFTARDKAAAHLTAGAKRVIVSAPSDGADLTVVYGINHDKLTKDHIVISNASCTTNGLAPVAKVMHEKFGIDRGLLTTVHAYTNSQKTVDTAAKDLRDARAAAENVVPSSTGAAKAVGLVIPELKGKFTGMAFRVPVRTVSVVDFTAILNREASVEEINAAMKEYAEGPMKGILAYTEEELVSSDLIGNEASSIFSAVDTVGMGNFVKVVAWYDNEWGYSCRIADLCHFLVKKGL